MVFDHELAVMAVQILLRDVGGNAEHMIGAPPVGR
jgi:hypothetical protein